MFILYPNVTKSRNKPIYTSSNKRIVMKYSDIQQIAVIYGKKELIEEFLEIFTMDRMHDKAPINAIKGDMKKDIKKFIWKVD